jgi:hypothetical protein
MNFPVNGTIEGWALTDAGLLVLDDRYCGLRIVPHANGLNGDHRIAGSPGPIARLIEGSYASRRPDDVTPGIEHARVDVGSDCRLHWFDAFLRLLEDARPIMEARGLLPASEERGFDVHTWHDNTLADRIWYPTGSVAVARGRSLGAVARARVAYLANTPSNATGVVRIRDGGGDFTHYRWRQRANRPTLLWPIEPSEAPS